MLHPSTVGQSIRSSPTPPPHGTAQPGSHTSPWAVGGSPIRSAGARRGPRAPGKDAVVQSLGNFPPLLLWSCTPDIWAYLHVGRWVEAAESIWVRELLS